MVKSPLEKAREQELRASSLMWTYRGGNRRSKELSDLYFKAGQNYETALRFLQADENYGRALKFAMKGDVEDLKTEIKDIKNSRKKAMLNLGKIKSGLEEKLPKNLPRFVHVFSILSMVSLVFALVFTSFSLTGFSVLELTQNNSCYLGTIFFVCGLVFAFVYFKKK